MRNTEQMIDRQGEVIDEAIRKYYESPQVVKLAAKFAAEQQQFLMNYSPRERIFTLSDGEPYTADYIIKHMTEGKATD